MSKEKWKVRKLGEIGKASMCKRIFKNQTSPIGDIPFYKIGTFGKEPDAYISKDLYNEYKKTSSFPKKGDVLISASGTIGRRVVYDGLPAYFQDSNIVWIDNDEQIVLNEYLYHFYGACKWEGTEGATISRLYNSNLREIEIKYPKSLTEQQRIVSLLNEAFEALDEAQANAEKNLENARELFESYLEDVFETKGKDWEENRLVNITTKIGSGATPRGGQASYKTEGISLVRSMNVHDWEFREEKLAFIDEEQAEALKGVTLYEDDVLLNITGASVARCCIIPKEFLPARVNQHVSIIRPIKEVLNSKFLNYMLTSKPFKDQLLETGEQGATRQAITKRQIENFEVSYPSLEKQLEIVSRLDNIKLEIKQLESHYQTKLNNIDELRKSVLDKAFNQYL